MLTIFLSTIESPEKKLEFELLYYEYRQLMFHVAYQILNDPHMAEDAVSEAFIHIAKNFDKIAEPISKRTKNLCVIITRNTSIDMFRHERKDALGHIDNNTESRTAFETVIDDMPAISDPFDVFGYEDLLEQIRKLPSIYRDALYMVSVAGYSIKDAAALFGVSNQTLRKRLQRGRSLLKGMLEHE